MQGNACYFSASRGNTAPDFVTQLLVRGNVLFQACPFPEEQVRHHPSKDNPAVFIEMSVVTILVVVCVSSVFANSVDIVRARLVKVEVQGTNVLGGFDSCDTLVLERLVDLVRGVEATSSKRRDYDLRCRCQLRTAW